MSIPPPRKRRRYPEDFLRELYERYKKGERMVDIAAESGVPMSVLSRHFKKFRAIEEGLPEATTSKKIKMPNIEQAGRLGVMTVLSEQVKDEATKRTQQYLEIGKRVASAYWRWATSKGIPLEEAVRHPIERIVPEALDKAEKYDRIVKRLRRLEGEIQFYRREIDPLIKLERALELMIKLMELAVICRKLFGINILRTPVGFYYFSVLENILTYSPLGLEIMGTGEEKIE